MQVFSRLIEEKHPLSTLLKMSLATKVIGILCALYTGFVGSILAAFSLDLRHDDIPQVFNSWNIPSINEGFDAPFRPKGLFIFWCWIGIFGLHHSLFARGWVAKLVMVVIPPSLERSFYVLVTSLLLHGMLSDPRIHFGGGILWNISTWSESHFFIRNSAALILSSYFTMAIFQLGGLSLIGIPQSFQWNTKRTTDCVLPTSPRLQHFELVTTGCYHFVRHPLQTSVLFLVWGHPLMTLQRFAYAIAFSIYILIGINLEEKECINMFGSEYIRYQENTPQLIPFLMFCPLRSSKLKR